MEHLVYILYSARSNRNYTGYTSNIIQRFASHNLFGKDSTALYRPWILIHLEFYETKEDALKKEKYYKSGRGSTKKNEIIKEYLARWAHTLPQWEGRWFEPDNYRASRYQRPSADAGVFFILWNT